jgi:competence protein ComEC
LRKLATAAVGFSAAVFAAEYLLPGGWLPFLAAGLGFCAAAALFLRAERRLRAVLLLLFAAAGLLWSWGYAALFIKPAELLEGERLSIRARALDYSRDYEGYSSVSIRVSEGGPAVKALLISRDGVLPALNPGDEFDAAVLVESATTRYGLESDCYTSRGVFLLCSLEGDIRLTCRAGSSLLYLPRILAAFVTRTVDKIFPSDTAGFIKALLTGDKTGIYADSDLYAAMNRAGFLHVVAVSGMHISFLIGFVRNIARSRKRTAQIGIPLLLLYVPLTGAGPSVIRAAFMLSCALIAPLLRREEDAPTSLAFILAVMLLLNPASAASVSLQLSFAAMAGILLLTPRMFAALTERTAEWKLSVHRIGRLSLNFVSSSLSSSMGALVFTVPLAAAHFGMISVVSLLTNLLCLWAVSALFIGGWLCVFVGFLLSSPGHILAWCLSWPARGLFAVLRFLAGIPYAAVYTSNPIFLLWLFLVYALFVAAWLFRGKRGFQPLMPLCLSLVGLCAAILLTSLYNGGCRLRVTALDVGQGQCIILQAGDAVVMTDCGGMGTENNAGDTAARYVMGRCIHRIDALMLTHFDADHVNGVERLMSQVEVSRLILPAGADETAGSMPAILVAAERHGTEVIRMGENGLICAGDMRIFVYSVGNPQPEEEHGLIYLCSVGDTDVLITGDASGERERQLIAKNSLPDLELLIVGHHGSATSTGDALLRALKPEVAVISVGYNHYGHPTQETLDRLAACGAVIHRTDREGNIVIRCP